jgi:hypothetical protein
LLHLLGQRRACGVGDLRALARLLLPLRIDRIERVLETRGGKDHDIATLRPRRRLCQRQRHQQAVRDRRIYLSPNLLYGWFDAPPGVNRLMGVRWLMSVLYPQQFPESLRDTTREFYKLFYRVDLTEPQIDSLLASATPSKSEQ